ncbi:NFX1-type zinc finger-containing protein 1-like isoform X3 [Pectinophora gossypiella]|uniref:NFX1-type zinc finger-containing protein 1-like isoform X2 n=1 Tax=Pectinophora gossypiella TaxID=13191 RepID=UPI00214DF1B1|nr:NFX1-type zinc finger-containing protein 1-like isoform X2 [Pectinophora gossypiella]XP_049873325.1 NFX1-type zinc finger-containing protein 1-like isoform X3 [Pectinophora gossypiella]
MNNNPENRVYGRVAGNHNQAGPAPNNQHRDYLRQPGEEARQGLVWLRVPQGGQRQCVQGFNGHDGRRQGYSPRQNQGRHNNQNRYFNLFDAVQENRHENRQQNRNKGCMGFRTLEEMAQSDINDIITKIGENKSSFMNLLESTIDKDDIYVLVVAVISKICQSPFDELKSKLLLDICNSRFMKNLGNYLIELPYTDTKQKNNLYWNNQQAFWMNYVTFCDCIINVSPSTALQKLRPLIEGASKCCLEGLNEKHGFSLSEEQIRELDQLRTRLTTCEKEDSEKTATAAPKKGINVDSEALDPPKDFRVLSVVPTLEDLLEQRPFVRPNIVDGSYSDVEHYLDVQFRLLREDYIGPLREGIGQLIERPNEKKYDHIRVYRNVKFFEPYVSGDKIGAVIQFDENTMKRNRYTNWAHNKRLIYGSLLLFTKDNCRSFITGTILDRDVTLLSKGKVPVSILNEEADNIYNNSYTMIESEIYFEPYYHVLKALQDPKFPENLAMQKYIVQVDTRPNPPNYVSPQTMYAVQTKHREEMKFNVLNDLNWPTKEDIGLNESQHEAYKLALTHEFAVIQGPPGTGKTFLGVKVAKTLLQNVQTEGCLMLVICYTNHALDQFLEAILSVTPSIVRIGGQSRNEAMEQINLTTLRKNDKGSYASKTLYYEQKTCLKIAIRELQYAQERLDSLSTGVIAYDSLKQHNLEVAILGRYYAKFRNNLQTDPLKHWLFEHINYIGFDDIVTRENIAETNEDQRERDDEEERVNPILDVFEDDLEYKIDLHLTGEEQINMSFSVADLEKKIHHLILLYPKITNKQKQKMLQREIVICKSQITFYYDMRANRTRQPQRVNNSTNFGAMSMADRWSLYYSWANVIVDKAKRHMKPLQDAIESANKAYEEARMILDLKMLKNVKVIGMTTSGAARLRKLLQALTPPIVIVEEAAEVLEQHIVTSLTKSCQHLILIGDHQQLRPSAAHLKLARHFNIEVSLFERMIKNGIHSRRLGVQHRMRPEIAALIAPHIYQDLHNHPSVEKFPNVRGMADNLFFLTHNYKEKEVADSGSRSNELEADMTLKLANYLMQQGYAPGDITVLATYSGQMFYMRKEREKYAHLNKVKITVVDNYQGEESKIILLSLVRNNDNNKIGFLNTDNRVCVALSRAREGFYILGNIEILKRNSVLWEKIATTLQNSASLGTSLMLKCENHPQDITTISSPKDFDKVPEGGCLQKCGSNLPCGHRCPLICHGYDRGHANVKCYQNCERVLCELGHVCPLICSVACEPCKIFIKKDLPCGHQMELHCFKDPTHPSVKCLTTVDVTLPKCGHEAKKFCYMKIESVKCPVRCIYRVQKCGHECRLNCHVDDDPDHDRYICEKPCANAKRGCTADLELDRGDHQCPKKCHETCADCTVEVVKKRSTCQHSKRVQCNEDVDETPCRKNCARTLPCNHPCKKKCHEQCGDCKQKVIKTIPDCNHMVSLLCMTPATRSTCRKKCERKLPCNHTCTQPCAELCATDKCPEIIPKKFQSPCGHEVMIPCHVYSSMNNSDEWKMGLLQYCVEACGALLACGHECAGTCARCRQGRLHAPCARACHRPNICGHQCNEPCSQACPPCNKPCEIKCPHSRCGKVCGVPCTPCKEKCMRSCRHGSCTRRCGEPCSRSPCDAACERSLPCGHACRGLCGEPCPDICRLCRPDDFPRDFLGDEFDDDVKFIQLQDCTHVLDLENMDNLMTGDRETVSIRTCPFCRTPIINTYRYKDLINDKFKTEINPIKEKIYGNEAKIKQKTTKLIAEVKLFSDANKHIFAENPAIRSAWAALYKVLKNQKMASLLKLETQSQYLEILEMIVGYYRKYKTDKLTALKQETLQVIQLLCKVLTTNVHKISQQFQRDMGTELQRMNSIIQLAKILSNGSFISSTDAPNVKQAAEEAKKLVFTCKVFDQNQAIIALKELQEAVNMSGIVQKAERDLIVKAIGSKAGSWYKCPNGHFYSIDACGGAMEISKCADCGVPIGGQGHALLASNAHAGEVDGSLHAAWSTAYNDMNNFRLD